MRAVPSVSSETELVQVLWAGGVLPVQKESVVGGDDGEVGRVGARRGRGIVARKVTHWKR